MTDSIHDILAQGKDSAAKASKIYGLVIGLVTNNKDTEKLGRVKVKFPWLDDSVESWWARIAYPMAGKERGYWWLPEIDDEVLVGFEHGDVRFPYIVGALHNGVDKPPKTDDITNTFGGQEYSYGGYSNSDRDFNADGKNDLRFIRSRSGHLLIFDDKDGKEKITLTDKTGSHRVEIFTDKKKIVITSADGDIEFYADKKVVICCEEFDLHTRKDANFKIDQNIDFKVQQNWTTKVQQSIAVKSGMDTAHESGTDFGMKAGTSMTIKGGTTADVSGGASIKCSGPMATFQGDGQCTVKGGMVMIN
ncbi:MAG TPA: phage baseplate assembly protein V [Planctomycetota bacterium]|nr:phage baseplate assembly protein V [Planctomycetota bacterium]